MIMKKIFIIILSLIPTTNVFADKCYNPVATPLILESDKKPGRFFEDQPDVNDDYQIHIVYSLLKDSKDKEGDINGAIEKWKFTKHDYKNIKDRRGTGEMCFYKRRDVSAPWENELGIFQKFN